MTVAFAVPPASHMVWSPYRPPVRSSTPSNVVASRAPLAPSGCPIALHGGTGAPPQVAVDWAGELLA
jgi:hypothetical protein